MNASAPAPPYRLHFASCVLWAALGLHLSTAAGCYDSAALASASRKAADSLTLEKLDMGSFYVTLPRVPGEAGGGVIEFRAFARVERRHRNEVAKVLKTRGPEIRSHALIAVRSIDPAQLTDPQLDDLRRRLAEAVNQALEDKHVEAIGFYKFSYTPL